MPTPGFELDLGHPSSSSEDELWWDGFGLPVVNGDVSCAVQYGSGIVIGGRFTMTGDVPANGIAYWDGAEWNALGQGIDGDVRTLAVYGGNLVAGGTFSHAGGEEAAGVAQWDGSRWHPLSSGLNDPLLTPSGVLALAPYGTLLVAGGNFTHSGNIPMRHLAAWDGSTWTEIGGGVNRDVRALAVHNEGLFVGGSFDSAGTVPTSGIAEWNGAWSALGPGVSRDSALVEVRAIVSWGDSVLVGGDFTHAGSLSTRGVALWNGTDWVSFGPGPGGEVLALAIHDDVPYVAGAMDWGGFVTWNGSAWEVGDPWTTIFITSLLSIGSDLIATGLFGAYNGVLPGGFNVARIHQGRWFPLEHWTPRMRGLLAGYGGAGQVLSLAAYQGEVVASGNFVYVGDPPAWDEVRELASWNGERWRALPAHPGWGTITTMLSEGNSLFIGGPFTDYSPETGYRQVPVYEFNGSSWTGLDTLTLFVTSLVRFHGDLYVAGSGLWGPGGNSGVYRWTGSRWTIVGPLLNTSQYMGVSSLVVYGDHLVAAGYFRQIGGVSAVNIAAWDGSTWQALGEGLPGPGRGYDISVNALTVHSGRLVAGHVEGVSAWDGTSWRSVGGDNVYNIWSLASIDGELFAGGYLWWLHDPPRDDGIARWDGAAWQSVGSGTNGPAMSFAKLGQYLYVGGFFGQAGGHGSFGIARWDGLVPSPPPPAPPLAASLMPASPNPFRASTNIGFQLANGGHVRISIIDLSGREVRVLEDKSMPGGTYTTAWDGRDRAGRKLGAAVYFIRIQHPSGLVQTRKAVRLR